MRRLVAVIIALIAAAGPPCETVHAAKKALEVRDVTFEGTTCTTGEICSS